jgi:hypothetical protein
MRLQVTQAVGLRMHGGKRRLTRAQVAQRSLTDTPQVDTTPQPLFLLSNLRENQGQCLLSVAPAVELTPRIPPFLQQVHYISHLHLQLNTPGKRSALHYTECFTG